VDIHTSWRVLGRYVDIFSVINTLFNSVVNNLSPYGFLLCGETVARRQGEESFLSLGQDGGRRRDGTLKF